MFRIYYMFVDIFTKGIYQIYHAVVRVVYRRVIDRDKTKQLISLIYYGFKVI